MQYLNANTAQANTRESEPRNCSLAYQAKIAKQHPCPNADDEKLNAIAAYCGIIEFLDTKIRRTLDALEKLGGAKDVIVVHWSDHGDMMGEHHQWRKRSFYEASARVPFIWQAPGRIRPVHTVSQNTSLVDIFPPSPTSKPNSTGS